MNVTFILSHKSMFALNGANIFVSEISLTFLFYLTELKYVGYDIMHLHVMFVQRSCLYMWHM